MSSTQGVVVSERQEKRFVLVRSPRESYVSAMTIRGTATRAPKDIYSLNLIESDMVRQLLLLAKTRDKLASMILAIEKAIAEALHHSTCEWSQHDTISSLVARRPDLLVPEAFANHPQLTQSSIENNIVRLMHLFAMFSVLKTE